MVMKKSELTERCRKIKDSYKQRTPLNDEDKQWMLEEIFKYHPHWDIKSSKTIAINDKKIQAIEKYKQI